MRYIIPYSFSQQNEFYKVYNTKQNKQTQKTPTQGDGIQGNQKRRGKKKITVPQNCFDFTASVPLQKYLHKCKECSPTA